MLGMAAGYAGLAAGPADGGSCRGGAAGNGFSATGAALGGGMGLMGAGTGRETPGLACLNRMRQLPGVISLSKAADGTPMVEGRTAEGASIAERRVAEGAPTTGGPAAEGAAGEGALVSEGGAAGSRAARDPTRAVMSAPCELVWDDDVVEDAVATSGGSCSGASAAAGRSLVWPCSAGPSSSEPSRQAVAFRAEKWVSAGLPPLLLVAAAGILSPGGSSRGGSSSDSAREGGDDLMAREAVDTRTRGAGSGPDLAGSAGAEETVPGLTLPDSFLPQAEEAEDEAAAPLGPRGGVAEPLMALAMLRAFLAWDCSWPRIVSDWVIFPWHSPSGWGTFPRPAQHRRV